MWERGRIEEEGRHGGREQERRAGERKKKEEGNIPYGDITIASNGVASWEGGDRVANSEILFYIVSLFFLSLLFLLFFSCFSPL